MLPQKNDYEIGNVLQFSPYIIFITVYSFLYYSAIHTQQLLTTRASILTGLPLFTVFITTLYACLTFKKSVTLEKKIEIFFTGAAHKDTIHYYFDIIFIAVFNHMIAKTNGVLTAITLSLLYISTTWIMPMIFLATALCAILLSSLRASILIMIPIAYGIAQSLHINVGFMAATIMSGALFGTHLLLLFHNNCLFEQKCRPQKFDAYLWSIISAGLITLLIILQYECPELHPSVYHYLQSSLTWQNYITILPYCFLFIAGLLRLHMIANLVMTCCTALAIEIIVHKTLFLDAIATMFCGFYKENIIVNIVLFYLMIAGLINIIQYNGGFDYIIEKLTYKKNQSSSSTQISIIMITILTNILVIIDALCLEVIGHSIKQSVPSYNLSKHKVTNILHITTTTMQIIVPYAYIMFVTINITRNSYIEIIKYMIYPMLIIIFMMISTFISPVQAK